MVVTFNLPLWVGNDVPQLFIHSGLILNKLTNMTSKPVKIFFSYSHKDEGFRVQLEKNLAMLKRQGLIEPWHDRMITAGDEWKGHISDNLYDADIVLLLVTANFLASDYCYDNEMTRAMELHESGNPHVLPIILTPVEGWKFSPFARLQVLPKDGKPVTTWDNKDDAYVNVAQGIRKVINLISQTTTSTGNIVENIYDQAKVEPKNNEPDTLDQQGEAISNYGNTKTDNRSGGMYFGDNTDVKGDIFSGDKTTITITSESTASHELSFSKAEVLQLLKELKISIKEASIDEDDKEIAVGQIAAAIGEAKNPELTNVQEAKDILGHYIEGTKTILDRVKRTGEINSKAFHILVKITKLLGL